jgi:hypothetical protein
MTWFLVFLGASVFSSIFVLAAGILSSRANRREDYVETFYADAYEAPANNTARTSR